MRKTSFVMLFSNLYNFFCDQLIKSVITSFSEIFVKSQQWPTPSESIAIYCVRKLVSCVTHHQPCAKVDIWNKKKKLRTVAKIKTQDYKNWRLQKFSTIATPPLNTATTLFNELRSQPPFGTSDRKTYSSRLAWSLSQAITWFATDRNEQRKKNIKNLSEARSEAEISRQKRVCALQSDDVCSIARGPQAVSLCRLTRQAFTIVDLSWLLHNALIVFSNNENCAYAEPRDVGARFGNSFLNFIFILISVPKKQSALWAVSVVVK